MTDQEHPQMTEFPDVPADHTHRDAIAWAAQAGIIKGFPDGRYRPGREVTRGQLAAILHRYHAAFHTDEQPDPEPDTEPDPDPDPEPDPDPDLEPPPGPVTGARVISTGGTHTLNIDHPGTTPAVEVHTTEPVTLRGRILSRGRCINVAVEGADITIEDLSGTWTETGHAPAMQGRFLTARNAHRVIVRRCELIRTEGIRLEGPGHGGTVRIVDNYAEDIRQTSKQSPYAQFLQLAEVRNADVEVARNHVVNRLGTSLVEDVISIYQSSGTAGRPIHIHDNIIYGAWPHPRDARYTGGGIMCGDGDASTIGHVLCEDNRVINTVNYGIACAAGSEGIVIRRNVVLHPKASVVPASNVGIYVWNYHRHGAFGGVEVSDNKVGWWRGPHNGTGRQDYWMPDVDIDRGNASLPDGFTLESA